MGRSLIQQQESLFALYQQAVGYRTGPEIQELYSFITKFRSMAPYNAFLVYAQRPGSRMVATPSDWKSRFNRTIKPGANPLVILRPFGPVEFVYELGDTEGPDPFPEVLLQPFKTDGTISQLAFDRLVSNMPRLGVEYCEQKMGVSQAGFLRRAQPGLCRMVGNAKVLVFAHLVVNQDLSREEKVATIAHELGHLLCGHIGSPAENVWRGRPGMHLTEKEFEAESVSYLVCERLGISSPAATYLSSFLRDGSPLPWVDIDLILKASGLIESMMERSLRLRKELVQ